MTPHQKMLVQTTFAQVAPIAETAAALFYGKLFELDPALRPLFKGDITEQGRKLMHTLGVAVSGLDKLEVLVPVVRNLGSRHAGYGVQDQHYETVAVALLWTLETGLGEAFTPVVREAWATVYWIVADTMKGGAAEMLAKSA
jgi:hemoglobin-like flavoprotein